jgi:hypothetical protein
VRTCEASTFVFVFDHCILHGTVHRRGIYSIHVYAGIKIIRKNCDMVSYKLHKLFVSSDGDKPENVQ